MTRFAFVRSVLLLAVVAFLGMPVFAHEGHEHKIVGTVSMLHEQHLEVKDKDGKAHVMTLNASTKIMKGKTAIKASDIKAGDRVVATVVTEKDVMIAKEVQVGVNADAKAAGKAL
ncbi:MAG: hypothetical protein IT305_27140 [Chloroflexi bacterium]|nr:hypothetical protein [Chloroflexota bacterium]